MVSRLQRVASVSAAVITLTAGIAFSGAAQANAAPLKAHVNSTGWTNLYDSPYGANAIRPLAACTNFYYEGIINGRYSSQGLRGYVSTDKAGPGWCGD